MPDDKPRPPGLKPIHDHERAVRLGRKGGLARAEKARKAKEDQAGHLLALSYGTLASVQTDPTAPAAARVTAAVAALNRLLGTPAQTIETTTRQSPYADLTDEELRARVAQLRAVPKPDEDTPSSAQG